MTDVFTTRPLAPEAQAAADTLTLRKSPLRGILRPGEICARCAGTDILRCPTCQGAGRLSSAETCRNCRGYGKVACSCVTEAVRSTWTGDKYSRAVSFDDLPADVQEKLRNSTPSDLDLHFAPPTHAEGPKTEDATMDSQMTPSPDTMNATAQTAAVERWQDEPKKLAQFWAAANKLAQQEGVKDANKWVHAVLDVSSIKNWHGTGAEALAALRRFVAPGEASPEAKQNGAPNKTLSTDDVRNTYTVELKGKRYLQVAGRVLLFRVAHPDWTISTDIVHAAPDFSFAIVKASILTDQGRLVATGHGAANRADAAKYSGRVLEKAETAAIGRALAFAGYGTDSADDIDEGEYLADSPVGGEQ